MRQLMIPLVLCFTLPLHARGQSGDDTHLELGELRIELDDLKHALKTTQVELGLFDERLNKQNTVLTQVKGQAQSKEISGLTLLSSQVNALEKKVSGFEKTLEKIAHDLRTLNLSSTQALNKIQLLEQSISSHEKRLDEVVKLKSTLTSISKAIGQSPSASPTKLYRIKAGDSLEKIARNNHTSIEVICKLNHLSIDKIDKIAVGQELRLPDDGT
jgi:LysM repeat protein